MTAEQVLEQILEEERSNGKEVLGKGSDMAYVLHSLKGK